MKDQEALENYFSLLKGILEENNLMYKPYNVDEIIMPLDHHYPCFT